MKTTSSSLYWKRYEKSRHCHSDPRIVSYDVYRAELRNKRESSRHWKLEISANKNHSLSWSPVVGVVMMAIGAGFYLLGSRKN
jgi:hypothetical protein